MAVEEKVELEGEVIEALKNLNFRVELENGHVVLAHLAGKMRRFRIRVLPGDRVRVEVSVRPQPRAHRLPLAAPARPSAGAPASGPRIRAHRPGASVM